MRKILFACFLVATQSFAQQDVYHSISDAFQSFELKDLEQFSFKWQLSQLDKDELLGGATLQIDGGGSIFIEHLDTISQWMSLVYSENFDEAGFILWMHHTIVNESSRITFILQKGDHCCDWVEKTNSCIRKNGNWISKKKGVPDLSWKHFYPNVKSKKKYPFLKEPPVYYFYPTEKGMKAELSYELYSLSYDSANEFFDKEGKEPKEVYLHWNKESSSFEIK